MAEGYPVVILAAGASRRMGTPKPLLDFDGRACLDLVIDACRAAASAEIVVVLGAEADRVRAGCRLGDGVSVVVNAHPERGQTSSVKEGLRALPEGNEGFFVLPCDHPLVEANDLKVIASAFQARKAGMTIVIPTYQGRRGHPVLIAEAHRSELLNLGDETPLHDYLRARRGVCEHVGVDNPGVLAGMNTDLEYEAALVELRKRRAGEGRL